MSSLAGALLLVSMAQAPEVLIDRVRTDVQANLAKLKEGRIVAESRLEQGGRTTEVTATVVWSGDRVYADWVQNESAGMGAVSRQEIRMVETPDLRVYYFPKIKLAQFDPHKGLSASFGVPLHPAEVWTALYAGTVNARPLLKEINTAPRGTEYEWRAEKSGPETTIRRIGQKGATFLVIADESKGGNVISYDGGSQGPTHAMQKTGSFAWEKHESGVWFVKSLQSKYTITELKTNRADMATFTLKTSKFNPQPGLATEQFSPEILQIAADATVEDYDGKTTTRRRRKKP